MKAEVTYQGFLGEKFLWRGKGCLYRLAFLQVSTYVMEA
jgi:hypothetical protein